MAKEIVLALAALLLCGCAGPVESYIDRATMAFTGAKPHRRWKTYQPDSTKRSTTPADAYNTAKTK